MVQLYMSKQMDVDALLTEAQYLQWVRDASAIVKLAVRSSPRKAQKTAASGGGFFRGSSLLNGTRPDSPAPDGDADSGGFDASFDPVMEEIDRWTLDGFDGHPAGVKQRPLCCAHATIVVLKDALELAQNSKSCRSSLFGPYRYPELLVCARFANLSG
jgi:hypothetical protein